MVRNSVLKTCQKGGRGWEAASKMNVSFRVTAMTISTPTFLLLGCRTTVSQHKK